MAEGRSRNLRLYTQDSELPPHRAEDDPLVELARIVSEDGGFHRNRRERQPQRIEPPRAPFSAELEAELTREFDQLAAAAREDAERQAGREAAARRQTVAPHEDAVSRSGAAPDGMRDARPATGRVLTHRRSPAPGAAALPALRTATFDDHAPRRIEAQRALPARLDGETLRGTLPIAAEADERSAARASQDRADILRDDATEAYDDFDDAFAREFAAIHGRQDPAGQDADDGAYAESYDDSYDEDGRDPHGADDSAGPVHVPPARSKRGLLVLAGVLGVMVLGGGVAAMMAGANPAGSDGPTPIVKADAGALKVMPEAEEAAAEAPGKMVFDRVAGVAPKSDGPLVERTEEPRDVESAVPSFSEEGLDAFPEEESAPESGKIEARISTSDAVEESGEAGANFTPLGPRRVRTVTIRPDGSVAEPQAASASADAATGDAQTTVRTVPVTPPEADVAAADAAPESGPSAADVIGSAAEQAVEDAMAGAEQTLPGELAADGAAVALPRQRPAVRVAALPAEAPEVAAAPPADAAPADPAPSDGFVVQLSSQRSSDQAQSSFTDLKRRFPAQLGDRQANIQKADLGEKGIYYRVRVGPMESRTEANRLCQELKAAGGSCFVTR